MTDNIYNNLSILGIKTPIASSPDEAILEKVKNPHKAINYLIRFSCPEFTSICPITGQPDFAKLIIDYVADEWLVESKSLKLFLASFRNHGAFHEDCTINIALRLIKELSPIWLRIGGYWFPRGGIPIDIFFQNSEPPKDLWIPNQDIAIYSGR